MVVTALYSDGSSKIINNYTYSPTGQLTIEDTNIIISFTEVGVTVSTSFSITITQVFTTLNDNNWNVINKISTANKGENYWAIGDYKEIMLNGTLVGTTFSNYSIYACIIGFNHNAGIEGNGKIHFQLGKIGQIQVALCNDSYGTNTSPVGFKMNLSDINTGGWKDSYMRKNVLGNSGTPSSPPSNSLLAVVEEGLRNALKSVNKWTDNTGGYTPSSSNVTSTTDYFFLLAEFEVYGSISDANQYEQNQQAQYDFYKGGNSKIRYKDTTTFTAAWWWLRSPSDKSGISFCAVDTNGTVKSSYADYAAGLAPGFCV